MPRPKKPKGELARPISVSLLPSDIELIAEIGQRLGFGAQSMTGWRSRVVTLAIRAHSVALGVGSKDRLDPR